MIFAYNYTNHGSTWYSPYHLLLGYTPSLPIDLILDQSPIVDRVTSYDQYLSKWEEAMKQAYCIAASKSKERKANDKNGRSKGTCLGSLDIGDAVLLRNCTERGGTGKLRSYWENDIFVIVDCRGEDNLVYEVWPEKSPDGTERRVQHAPTMWNNFRRIRRISLEEKKT